MLPTSLLLLALAVSLYDRRTGRVPNSVTLPMLVAGLLVNFPGISLLWLLSLILYSAWQWIERLVAAGITGGCGNGNYCPNNPATRAQMAIFLVKTFDLP